jgi:tight adherence protein B
VSSVQTSAQRGSAVAVVIGLLALLVALPSVAQEALELRLRDAQLRPDGNTRLVVGVDGTEGTPLDASAFEVFEDGQAIPDLEVQPVLQGTGDGDPVETLLLLDTSGSMDGEPIERIRAAATETARSLTDLGAAVGVIEFATSSRLVSDPTLDVAALAAAIEGMEAGGWTSLYDSIINSVNYLETRENDLTPAIVVFADGEDNRSEASREEAIEAAQAAGIPLTMVVLETERLDMSVLTPLASETGGTLTSVESLEELEEAFAQVTRDIANQYVIRYRSDILEPAELPISVVVNTESGDARVDSFAINSREAGAAPPAPSELWGPRFAWLATTTGLYFGISVAFLAALLLLYALLVTTRRTAGSRTLEQSLRTAGRNRGEHHEIELPTARFTERAIDLVSRVPRPAGFDQRLQLQLDRAAWLMRTNEFLLMCFSAGLLGLLLVRTLADSWPLAIVVAIATGLIPVAIVNLRIAKRRRDFIEQLPATLQLLAGSLRAGYGLLQALDTVVKESEDPTASEFSRVLTEARLGMPLDEAMEGMAQRLGSKDFHWVVLAIGIQREVGGNLAELLSTVSSTMRGRATLRRQIQVLSAEGRISAWIMAAMPFVVALILSVINPGYLNELFFRVEGYVMLGAGFALLALGAIWLKKIVTIEV